MPPNPAPGSASFAGQRDSAHGQARRERRRCGGLRNVGWWRRWARRHEVRSAFDTTGRGEEGESVNRFVRFSGRVIAAHVVTYIGVGVVAYTLLTHQFFEPHSVAAQVMRTPADPQLWRHVTRWMLPAQVLRGLLIAAVLFPFVPTMLAWSYLKRAAALFGLYVVLGQWASTVAGSGTIEGWLILRPEFTEPRIVWGAMGEGLAQGIVLAAWLARWMTSLTTGATPVGAAQLAGGPASG